MPTVSTIIIVRVNFALYNMLPQRPMHVESFAACPVPIVDNGPEILGTSPNVGQFRMKTATNK